jgi:hypothetical protein
MKENNHMAKRKQASADDILKQMYPDLMTSDDFEKKEDPKQTEQPNAQVAELQAKLAALESQLSNVGRANAALSSQITIPQAPQPPQIDMSKAPDPVENPQGYAKFIMDAANAKIDYEKNVILYQQEQSRTQSERVSALWNDFSSKYKEYAADDERVAIATQQVVAKARAKGIDPEKYMYGQSEIFMKDVVGEMDRLFGKPGAAAAAGADDDEDDEDDVRTDVFGGATAGTGQSPATRQAPPEKYGSLSKDLMAWQEKTGFHR